MAARSGVFNVAVLFLLAGLAERGHAQAIHPELYNQLEYRFIGPQGNRVSAVVGEPGNPLVYYVGAASGGVWKSTDGGINWGPIFDDQPAQSIGALAVSLSDPNIVWAGTGEAFIRSNISIGNGIYKSTDAGKTWTHMGLEKTGRIGRIVIHPRDPNIVFAAAMGHCYGPQQERGVFRTTDGGSTWERVLFVDEKTGCSDLAMDPGNPRILFAGMWQLDIKTWGRWSGGPGSGVFMSKDGGSTWKRITGNGLPEQEVGKIALAVAPSDSNRVYALIETKNAVEGSLWRSDDGGGNWKLISYNQLINERPHYYSRMAVTPDNPNEVYFPCNLLNVTYDGGDSIRVMPSPSSPGGDNHDMWIDPLNPNRMMVGNDAGVSISLNRSHSWNRMPLPIAQMYHVAVDNQIPYNVYGNRQDGYSYRGPSNSRLTGWRGGGISSASWITVSGCECGFAVPDPVDNNIVWGGCYNGRVERFDLRTRHSRDVRVWPESPMGSAAGALKYRFNWTFPITISPHDHNKVYIGSQHVHQTTDGGQSWKVISPDLSTNDQSKLGDSGGLTLDHLGVEYGCLVFAIAESPLEEGLIWAGTNDGLVHVTRDGGASWTDVTRNLPDLPPWGTVSNIEPSRYDGGTCYITVDFHQVNNRDPYVYKTTDYGQSWKSIGSDVPRSVFSYAHCVREDPVRKGLLYLGTENALYVSFNYGENWVPLQNNMPHAPVHWMVVQEDFNDLVVATYGRGFWIMDDITPLQELNREVLDSDVHLFAPRPAYRFLRVTPRVSCPLDHCLGENPPDGASINYYLKSAHKGEVRITILDENGKTVRTLKGPAEAGINRIWWNLRYEPPKQAKLRTKPVGDPHTELRFNEDGWRPIVSWGVARAEPREPMVVPGIYTVKLSVEGRELAQSLTVEKDPSSAGTIEDIKAKVEMSLELRDNINTVVDSINRIEWIRKQIYDLVDILEADQGNESVVEAADELDKKLIALEENFFQVRLTQGDMKSFRWPLKLYSKLSILAGDLQNTAYSVGSDFAPTNQQIEVHELLKRQLADSQQRLKEVLDTELAQFNDMLEEKHIQGIVTANP